jgi:putative transposase
MRRLKFEIGKIYHVFNRGVEKRSIFLSDGDRWRFLQGMYLFNDENSSANLLYVLEQERGKMHFNILREYMSNKKIDRKPLVRILADCLKPNHFHLLLEEIQENGISRFMHKLSTGYTGFFNKKYERVGGLFQGTFKAVEVESDGQLTYLLAYINAINPGQEVEPELKSKAQNPKEILEFIKYYPWSTHPEYSGRRDSIIVDKTIMKNFFSDSKKYEKFITDIIRGKKKFGLSEGFLLE